MRRGDLLAALALGVLASACTTGTTTRSGPVEVTRYHLGEPIPAGTVAVVPVGEGGPVSPAFAAYADAVGGELARLGYTTAPADRATYVAAVGFTRAPRGVLQSRPPVSIGLGGGSYGGGFGGGGGVSFGLGGGQREVLLSELSVQIKRRADDGVVWEGRAQTQNVERPNAAVPPAVGATRLAGALFRAFPGESGITTTVP